MFKYVGDISQIAQDIIFKYCYKFEIAIDATLGNGHDTDFLSSNFNKVYSFDIQKESVENYSIRKKDNVFLINESHEHLGKYINYKVDCVMFNLGFLPGGDKTITTMTDSTVKSIKSSLELLSPGGIVSIAIYSGHEEGKREKEGILNLLHQLPKNKYGVLLHTFLNRNEDAPLLAIVEKTINDK